MEEQTARNWYGWLWLSPLITIPTFFVLARFVFWQGPQSLTMIVDYRLGRRAYILGSLGSSLWHLILLVPALNKKSEFVRWHGRQALLLAGVQSALSLGWGLISLFKWFTQTGFPGYLDFCAGPTVIGIWFGSTLWSYLEAYRGECSLMRSFGRAEAQPARMRAAASAQEAEAE